MTSSFIAKSVAQDFAEHGLNNFDAWWTLDIPLVDALNHRGDGWSGVAFYSLGNGSGPSLSFYIKRQENYNQRTLSHLISGVPTFAKEFCNIQLLSRLGVPSLTPLYFAERKKFGKHQAILVTQALEGFENVDTGFREAVSEDNQHKVMARCGQVARQLNDAGYSHGCLYPKHLFYQVTEAGVDVRLIDIEKLKWRPWKRRLMFCEIERFIRRRGDLSDAHLSSFLHAYLTTGTKNLRETRLGDRLFAKI